MIKFLERLLSFFKKEEVKEVFKPYAYLKCYLNNGNILTSDMNKEQIEEFIVKIESSWKSLSVTNNYFGICFDNVTHYVVIYTQNGQ